VLPHGSEWFIAAALYFPSRRAGTPNIGRKVEKTEPAEAVGPGTPPFGVEYDEYRLALQEPPF